MFQIIDRNGVLHPGLDQELMTGWVENFTEKEYDNPDIPKDMPISRITIGLLDDLGYLVDYNSADPYDGPVTTMTQNLL